MCNDGNVLCPGDETCPEKRDFKFPHLGDVRMYIVGEQESANYRVTSAVLLPGGSTWRFVETQTGRLIFITVGSDTITVKQRR